MRLIDVDALKESFGDQRLDGDWCICGDETTARDLIDEAPIIDAEPVRHGKWEWFEEKQGNPFEGHDEDWGYRCSCCKSELPDDYDDSDTKPNFDYCMYCGAKMDLNDW